MHSKTEINKFEKSLLDWDKIDPLIEAALYEDFDDIGDVTTDSILDTNMEGKGKLVVHEPGVIAGLPVVDRIFRKMDPQITCQFSIEDGDAVRSGTLLGEILGPIHSILKTERTALNFLQRLSGIATLTSHFVQSIKGTGVKILDTRKTTPQLRILEKYAVRKGGGENHRFGLYDMVMIKDNHIDAYGSITEAVTRCANYLKDKKIERQIEVETRSLDDVKEALQLPIHRIMLDNMDIEMMRKAVIEINGKKEVEASGSMSLDNVLAVAETGVDFISVGSLTHSVKSLDISLKLS